LIAVLFAGAALVIALGLLALSLAPDSYRPSRRRVQLRIDRDAFRAETQIDWAVARAVEEMLAAARQPSPKQGGDASGVGPRPLGG
jgi:hypothetical protein